MPNDYSSYNLFVTTKEQSVFAFLVHPRTVNDIRRKFPFLHLVPASIILMIVKYLPPTHVGNIFGFHNRDGVPLLGKIVAVSLTAAQMLSNRELAQKKVLSAIHACKKMGATHIGLGAYTSVVTDGGVWLEDKTEGVFLTNGNALTSLMSFRGYLEIRNYKRDSINPVVAVIGATGSIGGAISKMIASEDDFGRLIIVGKSIERTANLLNELKRFPNASKIESMNLSEAISIADIIIIATSSADVIITPDMPKKKSVIYDVAQPKNISKDLEEKRPDVKVVEGGLTVLPKGCSYTYNFGIPKNTMFSCMAETILMAQSMYNDNFCLGHVTSAHTDEISILAKEFGFEANGLLLKKE